MSAQTRFRTLVQHIGRIYSAKEEGGSRTELLQSGLNEIMTVIGPKDAKGWATVTADSERLLHIWVAKESDSTAAAVSTQLVNLLKELASAEELKDSDHPVLVVSETNPNPNPNPNSNPVPDIIRHSSGLPIPVPAYVPTYVPVPVSSHLSFPVASRYTSLIESKEDLEEVKEVTIGPGEEVVEEEEEVVEEEEEEVLEEEEVVEPEEEEVEEAEEEEEEGMEVEKYFHRGRSYWRDTNTDKLYSVIDGDEVGDEVGALVGGKPQFLAA